MRKFTLLLIVLFAYSISYGQSSNPYNDESPNSINGNTSTKGAKGNWTLQYNYPVKGGGTAGCETDGNYFYVAKWNSDTIFKYNMNGTYNGFFKIPGVTGLRDLAFDGTYFYGGKATTLFYKMDFDTSAPYLVSTITSPVNVRNISYDPAANNNDGGFWVGDWATTLYLVSRTGATLASIPAATHGQTSVYGTAFDNVTPGGPFIWTISANNTVNTTITQIKVSTGLPTGVSHDLTTDVTVAGNIGGGLFIHPNIVGNTVTLGGLIQNVSLFGYDLASVIPDSIDLAVESINIKKWKPAGQNIDVKGIIRNKGLNTITSFLLNYQVDNGLPVTQIVTGVNIPSMTTYQFTHSTPWFLTLDTHNIIVWTSLPNGVNDMKTSNDSIEATIIGYDSTISFPRKVLLETFTSSTCVPCVAGNANMLNIMNANLNKWVTIKYQMSWPGSGDPYYTAEGGTRKTFYNVSSVPNQEIDGGYNGNSSSVVQADFDNAFDVPAYIELDADMIIDTIGKNLTVSVNLNPNIVLPSTAKLFIGIVEKTTYKNKESNGETKFNWVMKKMLPNASGISLGTIAPGVPVSFNQSYIFNGDYRLPADATSPINHAIEHSVEEFSDLIAVVWIQNTATKEVYQSCYSSFTLGIAEQHPEKMISNYYPNPANNKVNFDFSLTQSEKVSLTIVNNLGQNIKTLDLGMVQSGNQSISVDVNELESGIYFFQFVIGNTPYTKPVVID